MWPTLRAHPLRAEDIVPLAAEDPRGLSSFYLLFGITLAGFIFSQTSHMYSKRLTLVQKLGQALLFAALAGLTGALISGPMIGVLPGPFLTVTAILVLLALATALVTMGFTALIGDPGIALSTLLPVILGNAVSGGAVPTSFLPDGFRPLSPLLPAAAGTHAIAEVSYVDPGGALRPVGVLTIWTLAALLLVVVSYRRQPPPRTP